MIEFPEVFYLGRPDPLDSGKANGAAMVEAFVGNPPFAGKNGISEAGGGSYLPWLQATHVGAHGNADLSAHFFRRAAALLGDHGTIGLIATNTIGQGDTRASGIQQLLSHGFEIVAATRDLPWPGDAAVTVSVVHLAKGRPAKDAQRDLDGKSMPAINSRLRGKPERPDPTHLSANAGAAFVGTYVLGMGFTLTPEEREQLVTASPKDAERIFPYLGGEEVNTSPTQSHGRYVINFGQMELADAEGWPGLIDILRQRVKPERDRLKDNVDGSDYKKRWWQHAKLRDSLYAAIAPLSRCLVAAIVSKHLMFSFQPTNRIFSHKLYAFPLEAHTPFAVLQSRIHNAWTWLLSSTMKTDLNYSASDCFETFPFPAEDPRTIIPELEQLGEALYSARAAYMLETDQGLTKTYNALKDPNCSDARILALRAQHEQLDAAVLAAYSWPEIPVPPFCIATPADRAALQTFEDEVIDRLFLLNAERAKTEAVLGRAGKKTQAGKAAKPDAAAATPKTTKGKAKKKVPPGGQGSLGWD